ncbi:MAG: DUF2237 family protein [Candidatus Poseidoniales archaeon]|jgi:uncharacterized protein (DUF2237 family)
MHPKLNVLGSEIESCSVDPITGWFRDGCCNTNQADRGLHVVCCILTEGFLEFALSKGNDLITPAPQHGFPGLKPGDRWCVCAQTWLDAVTAGIACPVSLESTHEEALSLISIDILQAHAE